MSKRQRKIRKKRSRRGRTIAATGVPAAVIGLAPSAAQAASSQPIEGYWYGTYNAQINFHPAAPGAPPGTYAGDITKLGTAACPTPAGLKAGKGKNTWLAKGSGVSYTGFNGYSVTATCASAGYGNATFTIDQANPAKKQTLTICSSPPGSTLPPSNCFTYTRSPAKARVRIKGTLVEKVKHNRLPFPVSCPKTAAHTCAGKIKLIYNGKTIMNGRFKVTPGHTTNAKLKLTKTASTLIDEGRKSGRQFKGRLELITPGLPTLFERVAYRGGCPGCVAIRGIGF